jgi:hypothetical protein
MKNYRYIILIFIIFLLCINNCASDKKENDNISLKEIQLQNQLVIKDFKIKKLNIKTDSLMKIKKEKVVNYVKNKAIVLEKYKTDTLIISFVEKCDSIQKLDSTIIATKDTVIDFLNDKIYLKNIEIDLHKKNIRKEKRNKISIAIVGAIAIVLAFIVK